MENKEKILVDSWGYSMTIVDFYKVIRESEKSVWVIPIGSKETADGYLQGTVVPNLEVSDPTKVSMLRKRPNSLGNWYRGTVKSNITKEGSLLEEWSGQPMRFNHCD